MLEFLWPIIALVGTTLLGSLAKIPMKLRPYVAVIGGILVHLFANGALSDGFQLQDIVDGVLIGLAAVGMYSGTKNALEFARGTK